MQRATVQPGVLTRRTAQLVVATIGLAVAGDAAAAVIQVAGELGGARADMSNAPSSFNVPLATSVPAGDSVLLGVTYWVNASPSPAPSINVSDTQGNIYFPDVTFADQASWGLRVTQYRAPLGFPLASGSDQIT